MKKCIICGEEAEKHHIIHKDEGGLDYPLNYIYLCKKHHRGPHGPHEDEEVDEKYKKLLLLTLQKTLPHDYYKMDELKTKIPMPSGLRRSMTKSLKHYKEGLRTMDIIDFLLSGVFIDHDEIGFDESADEF